ncbi:MAG: TIM barrel protein, partial [Clostridia bacterium]|nr:TIM barrel protein [Clostridia bacterium]
MILFGPSGNSDAFFEAGLKNSEQSAVWVKNLGLDAFEYSFGRGVLMSEEKALSIGKAFAENNVKISVHAPYYINFANPDPEMIEKSIGYVLKSAEMVRLMGGERIIIHPATQGKDARDLAF